MPEDLVVRLPGRLRASLEEIAKEDFRRIVRRCSRALGALNNRSCPHQGGQKGRGFMSTIVKHPSNWMAIMDGDGTTCLGHAISRGRLGIEGYNVSDELVGFFPTLADVAAALASLAASP